MVKLHVWVASYSSVSPSYCRKWDCSPRLSAPTLLHHCTLRLSAARSRRLSSVCQPVWPQPAAGGVRQRPQSLPPSHPAPVLHSLLLIHLPHPTELPELPAVLSPAVGPGKWPPLPPAPWCSHQDPGWADSCSLRARPRRAHAGLHQSSPTHRRDRLHQSYQIQPGALRFPVLRCDVLWPGHTAPKWPAIQSWGSGGQEGVLGGVSGAHSSSKQWHSRFLGQPRGGGHPQPQWH